MYDPAGPGSRRGGSRARVPGPPSAYPADGGVPAGSRIVELAAELLDVTNGWELERFLGRLVAETARMVGGRLPVDTGRSLVADLRRIAERTVPTLTATLGDETGAATAARPSVAETAARVYGLELEGMSPEDRDYEIARQFLRFGQAATARAATAPAQTPAAAVADAAVAGASREFAPGLLPPDCSTPTGRRPGPLVRRRADGQVVGVPPPTA